MLGDRDGLGPFLGLSFAGDRSLASFLRSLISQHNLDMTLLLSSTRDPMEGEKFSER